MDSRRRRFEGGLAEFLVTLPHGTELSSLKLLLWTAIAGLVFGLIGFGELLEDVLRSSPAGQRWL